MILENGLKECNCKKKSCIRHGKCAECLKYHKENSKYLPYCKRKKVNPSKLIKGSK
ncbi:hypothetical protein Ccel_3107 [Ruminiclostridium cellulolyticum H10]|uniref:Uncharacterized protein n=1 Tax=Ruminiclostridium cellulolyticum (strain ATCC 35319 / DSM 5812 / JCM 6584 / H10) TaxID=394503 RepID=B8I073_RUMCH|nr:hypothetical protein Ccel_3107 [Ruminiclostridium cellulolyticum H10]